MLAIAGYGFAYGYPEKLYLPTDYTGRTCGTNYVNDYRPGDILFPNYPPCQTDPTGSLCLQAVGVARQDLTSETYLWYMDIGLSVLTFGGVCVSYCPGAGPYGTRFCPPELNQTSFQIFGSTFQYCTYIRFDMPNVTFPVTTGSTLDQVLSSSLTYEPVLLRCVPTFSLLNSSLSTAKQDITSYLNSAGVILGNLFGDIIRSWIILVIICIIAFILSFSYLLLIRVVTGIVVYLCLICLFVLVMGFSAFCMWYGWTTKIADEAKGLDSTVAQIVFYGGVAIGAFGLFCGLVLSLMILRIRKAIGIIQEATKGFGAMPQLFFVPLSSLVVFIIFLAYWICVFVFIYSTGLPTIEGYTVRYQLNYVGNVLIYFHIFGFFWISSFISAFTIMVVAGAIGSWYWKRDKRLLDPRSRYVSKAFLRTFVYHIGTVAFGSLLVAILQAIRIIFEKMYVELKKAHLALKILPGVGWAVRIFLWVFEHIVKFVNEYAYIQTALYGTHFIKSAMNAFALISRNLFLIGLLHTVCSVIFFCGKVLVAFLTAFAAYVLTTYGSTLLLSSSLSSSSPILITVLAFFIGYFIASIFISILYTAVDTVLQCFLIDTEMAYGNPDYQPYCSSTSLSRIIAEGRAFHKIEKICQCCCCCTYCGAVDDNPELKPPPNIAS